MGGDVYIEWIETNKLVKSGKQSLRSVSFQRRQHLKGDVVLALVLSEQVYHTCHELYDIYF